MKKNILIAIILFAGYCCYSQTEGNYLNKPFSIYSSSGKLIIAGGLSTYVYSNYYGKDVKRETYSDPHLKPEYLVYELFKNMKVENLNAIDKLYDTSFRKKNFDADQMKERLKNYTDIKFISKFKTGDMIVVRYDFVSAGKEYAYFAVVKNIEGKFYLTSEINLSDPFNVVGSLSPYNLFNKPGAALNTSNMTPFYFVEKENKIFFTNQLPNEDHTALYLAFDFYDNNSSAAEIDFMKQLQEAAQSIDPVEIKNLLAKDELASLSDPYFKNYFYEDIKKVFKNYSVISPLASIKTDDGRILYFRYSAPGQSSGIASILLKRSGDRYYLSLRMTDGDVNNILQNVYIREAIHNYFKQKQ